MKKLLVVLFAAVVLGGVCPLSMAAAQEDQGTQDTAGTEDIQSGFGYVISVSAASLTIKEFDYESDDGVEGIYAVTAETRLENIEAITDLQEYDDVDVEYREENGQKVLVSIAKVEEYEDDQGAGDWGQAGGEMEEPPAAPAAE